MEKINYWEGLKEYDSEKVAEFMQRDFEQRLELFEQKDAGYGGSWQKDGLNGAFLNLKRKWDRLEHIFKSDKLFEDYVETVEDTLKDLENYAGMFFYLYTMKLKQYQENLTKAKVPPTSSYRGKKPIRQGRLLKSVPQSHNLDED
jgi:hypothetical protein